jgi:hypothetical protein
VSHPIGELPIDGESRSQHDREPNPWGAYDGLTDVDREIE